LPVEGAEVQRPHVQINVAATADGKIDSFERRGAAISSERDKERVDRLRADSDAIMIGGRTLHDEDPKLTVRSEVLRAKRKALGLPENPTKVAVASQLALKPDCQFLTAGPAPRLLFTTTRTGDAEVARLRLDGAEVFVQQGDRVNLQEVLETLNDKGIKRLMVEGGATLNFELLRLGLVDELTVFVAPAIFGGETAPTLAGGAGLAERASIRLDLQRAEQWEDGGVLLHYAVRQT
jgi:2,5-diamino-6-(ribosylamino)-4(3H)-pyrimidinone 5'-phosphate reductase